jgi:hypothetical protein
MLDKKGKLALDLKKEVLKVQLRMRALLEKMFVSCHIQRAQCGEKTREKTLVLLSTALGQEC